MENFTNFLTLENITFQQPLDVIVSILFFFSVFMLSEKIARKIYLLTNNNLINKNIILISIIIFLSYLSFFYSIFYNKIYITRYILLIFIFISFFYSFEKKFFNFKFDFFSIFLIIYFLLSLSPPTDADSLDYHLGYPLEILRNGNFPRYDWFHSWLIGIGDYLNYFGLILGVKNLGQLINFFGLLIIYNNIKYLIQKYKINSHIYIFLFSTPLLIWFITSQKPQLFPAALVFTSFILLDINFKSKYFKFFIIITFLTYAFLAKISFIFSVSVIYIYLIYLNLNSKKELILCSFVALVLAFPIFLKNYLFYSDFYPPLFGTILGLGDLEFISFSEGLARDKASFENLGILQTILFPIFLSIPQKISNMSIYLSLGFNIFFLFLFMKKSYKSKEFWFILVVTFSILYMPNYQPRYFLEVYLILIILVAQFFNQMDKNIYFKYFKIILTMQCIIIFIFSSLSIFTLSVGSISPYFYKDIMNKNAHNYGITVWINNNIPKNASIVSNIVRSHALYKNKFISRERFFLQPYYNSFKYKPDYVVLNEDKDQSLLEYKEKCLTEIKQENFFIEKRNFLSRDTNNKFKATLYLNKCK